MSLVTMNCAPGRACREGTKKRPKRLRGFTVLELMVSMAVGVIVTAAAVPLITRAMTMIRLNSVSSSLTAAISATRYQAIMNSQIYTLVLTTPANTYVVTNLGSGKAFRAVPIPSQGVTINGGVNATYTFTFCPNGMVYGAGGACPGPATPALTLLNQSKQVNISVSGVGNVTTTHN
jgi:prepilin-type N-terminal cleavage/methylation domain-containing protein